MEPTRIGEIARELCDLLDRQMTIIREHRFNSLTDLEMKDYEERKTRITQLRAELEKLARPM